MLNLTALGVCGMFWKKKNPLFDTTVDRAKFFTALAQLQMTIFKLLSSKLDRLDSDYKKCVIYVFYDTFAQLHAQQIDDEQTDSIKAYLRDCALVAVEEFGEPQFRNYSAEATDLSTLKSKLIHPYQLLEVLEKKPVFDHMLRSKSSEKINELTELMVSNDQAPIRMLLVELLLDDELIKSFQDPVELSSISLKCGVCSVEEELKEINARENSRLCIFKTGELRAGDDLQIFSCYCFECQTVTKFAFDPYDFSDNAEDGVEYFDSYGVELGDVKNALRYLRETGDFTPTLRLISSFPEVVDELRDL